VGFQRVLIAVDDTLVSTRAARVGIELAISLRAEVGFVFVRDTDAEHASDVPSDDLMGEAKQEGKELLSEFQQHLPWNLLAAEFIRVGKPGDEIVKAAKEWPADIIVIGSHGRSGITRALVGSVAEAVMRHAPCPVLVIRGKE
jgi:nucleotide-binding universal stress UspA family protein